MRNVVLVNSVKGVKRFACVKLESPTKARSIEGFLDGDYEVVACKGHIRDIREDPFGVDIDNDFEVAWVYVDKEIIDELKEKASRASEIILATDPDREGEAIAWHLCQVLDIDVESKCRITYQEVTEAAVKNALEEPRSIDMDLVHAALDRSIIDYIIGFKVSPLLWKNYASGLSAGRVQRRMLIRKVWLRNDLGICLIRLARRTGL